MSDRDGGPSSAGDGAPALVVEHLSERFGDRVAFEDVSFAVGHGEVFGFLGPNGAGKTTTVRTLGILAGLATAVVAALVALNGIHPTLGLAVGLAAAPLLGDGLGWQIMSATFDRERLITTAR
jgi:ABC-type multidrug transport system fused ATPase/permease subunit